MFKSTWIAMALAVAAVAVIGISKTPDDKATEDVNIDGIDGSGHQRTESGSYENAVPNSPIFLQRGIDRSHQQETPRSATRLLGESLYAAVYAPSSWQEISQGIATRKFSDVSSASEMQERDDKQKIARTGIGAEYVALSASQITTDSEEAGSLMMYGPIQEVSGATINVMGQDFDVTALGLSDADLGLFIGQSAYVEAGLSDAGFQAVKLEVFHEYSVPGASPVLLSGVVGEAPSDVGVVRIADLEIDVTRLDLALEAGTELTIVGIQPLPEGLILGEGRLEPEELSRIVGITGSSGRGITGSSGRGITGSSGRGITGSSGRGITGSSGR